MTNLLLVIRLTYSLHTLEDSCYHFVLFISFLTFMLSLFLSLTHTHTHTRAHTQTDHVSGAENTSTAFSVERIRAQKNLRDDIKLHPVVRFQFRRSGEYWLFNAKMWFICKFLTIVITIYIFHVLFQSFYRTFLSIIIIITALLTFI